MTHIRRALVIGGGIAGPVAALALRRIGIEASVHEAYPTVADGVGGSLSLAPNGMAALRHVDAHDTVRAIARPMSRTRMTFGFRPMEMPSLPDVPPSRLVCRSELHRVLHDHAVACGIVVEHGRRLVSYTEDDSGVTARFADGHTTRADILIGADGVHSTVRRLMDPDAPGPLHTGLMGFEGVSDHEVPDAPDVMTFAFGHRGYYLYRRAPGGGTEWGAHLPEKAHRSLEQVREVSPEDWLRVLGDIHGRDVPGGDLVARTPPERLLAVGPLWIMPRLPRWHRSRVVLVGDAAHAPSNTSGQGASLAIESAVQVARCLRDLPDASTAFAAFERLRRPRVERIAADAAKVNNAKTPGPLMRGLMRLLMPLLVRTVMAPERRFGAVQRYRVEWEKNVTVELSGLGR